MFCSHWERCDSVMASWRHLSPTRIVQTFKTGHRCGHRGNCLHPQCRYDTIQYKILSWGPKYTMHCSPWLKRESTALGEGGGREGTEYHRSFSTDLWQSQVTLVVPGGVLDLDPGRWARLRLQLNLKSPIQLFWQGSHSGLRPSWLHNECICLCF